ncbi:hypothetical protein IAR50_000286 [Cryptococcus sp. DSM 104548]
MGHTTIPPNLIALLSSPQTPTSYATDALEEWILHRRTKGDDLFDTSVGLVELEDRTPPHLTYAFDRARYLTNVPHISDLSPPTGPFPLSRSASTSTILAHLLSSPLPTIQHSRQVILEYALARETRLREKKPGRAGKGTLGREAFEDIAKRMGEIEDGLRQHSPDSPRRGSLPLRDAYPSPQSSQDLPELNESQQTGLTLILSLRMSLSYFTLQELADQLLLLALGDAERMLVQHIRRRVPGEGRWGVGKELEFVESLTLGRRPALRPAFRSAKARTLLPPKALYPVPLPAPSKSQCIKHIQALVREFETNGAEAAAASLQSHAPAGPPLGSPGFMVKRAMGSPTPAFSREGTPVTPLTMPPVQSPRTPARRAEADPNIISNFVHEIISEYITREKRDYMLKSKWSKNGRAQLSKDLGEIESALCLAGKNSASALAPTLIPTFLILRRTFFLPPSPLPQSITEPYLDILPAPPDADDIAFREPTVSSTTAALYVNPRLDEERAYEVMEELVEFEKEKVEGAGGSEESMVRWALEQLEAVQKRFPDGSYAATFAIVKQSLINPSPPASATSIAFAPSPTPSVHRRTRSHAFPDAHHSTNTGSPVAVGVLKAQHSRSLSMPSRKGTYDEESDDEAAPSAQRAQVPTPETQPADSSPPRARSVVTKLPQLPPLVITPLQMDARRVSGVSTVPTSAGTSGGGWWDVISAVGKEDGSGSPAPWEEEGEGSDRRSTGMTKSSSEHLSIGSGSGFASASGRDSFGLGQRTSTEVPLPPGAEAASLPGVPGVPDVARPMMTLDLNSPESSPPKSVSPPTHLDRGSYEPDEAPYNKPHAVTLPPRVNHTGHPSYDDGRERLPPPPPLRFDQPRGTTLGSNSNSNGSSPSFSSETPTPTGMHVPRLSPAPFYPTAGGTSPVLTPTTATAAGPSPPTFSGPSIAFAHSPELPKSTPSPPTPSTTPPVKASKLGTFGRTMSLARSKSKKEKAEKEKERERERAGVMNDPKRWNRSAVQNIMGPPAR